VLYKLTF